MGTGKVHTECRGQWPGAKHHSADGDWYLAGSNQERCQDLAVITSQAEQPARFYLSQVRKLRFREAKEHAQGHTGSAKGMHISPWTGTGYG